MPIKKPSKSKPKDKPAGEAAYIVELSGGGDNSAVLVGRSVWNWINKGGKEAPGSLARAFAKSEGISEDEAQARLAEQEDDNDRAMRASSVAPASRSFDSGAEAQRAAGRLKKKVLGSIGVIFTRFRESLCL